jgi:hypothetical protein
VVRWRYLIRAGLAVMLVSALGGATNVGADSSKSGGSGKSGSSGSGHASPKLDRKLNERERRGDKGTSRVIIQLKPGYNVSSEVT